jgi:Ca2+-binding EF-hand superfamily protein
MKKIWITALLFSGLMAAGQGFNAPSFAYFDTNLDGKITQAELEEGRANRHAQMAKEGRMLRNAQNAPSFSELDANGDGFITKEEFAAHQKAMRGTK